MGLSHASGKTAYHHSHHDIRSIFFTSITMEDYRKQADFWFFDGNVILSASESTATRGLCTAHVITLGEDRVNSSTSVLFRVHKGVLARYSAVFREMFNAEDGERNSEGLSHGEDLFEGIPLVRMQDSCEEVQALLEALYDP